MAYQFNLQRSLTIVDVDNWLVKDEEGIYIYVYLDIFYIFLPNLGHKS